MTRPHAFITTSWDDGHPLDFRVADLLCRYGLPGTFYIPRRCDHPTLPADGIRTLAESFEIGAHTLDHVDLTDAPDPVACQQIVDSKSWIEDTVGRPCHMFCPPKGHFLPHHLRWMAEAGYAGARTVELLSLDPPRRVGQLRLMPTTLQAHPHGLPTYMRNIAKRRAARNLWLYLVHGHATDLLTLASNLLSHLRSHGGVFHLWGHSWEVEAFGQWHRLDDILRLLRDVAREIPCVTNAQLCVPETSPKQTTPPADVPLPVAGIR
jgi:peptidoglycan/xylan/chitin deacetylase (PgdA/CDA1 family)